MNKNFALVLSCAVSILGLVSCNNKETDMLKPKDKTHTVIFKAQTPDAAETKTALHLRVVPDWRKTDVNDVHIFETETSSSGATYRSESNLVKMETPIDDNWSLARFSAAFDNASVIVTPPTKAEPTPGFKYTAIMASTLVEDDKTVKYIVPSVQYPDEVAWIDPKADMLVGSDPTIYPHYLEEDEEIGLSFKRPVALARLAITNLEGTTVSKVKITTANHITGYVTYDEINFDKNTIAEFNGDDSNKELTILYPEGKKKTTTFYAYFVCVPGTIQFSKIEVYTDLYVFTKAYATPASLTLTAGDFMNIALDMTPKDNNGVTRTGLGQQTLKFVDADENVVTAIDFDLVKGKDSFVAPTLVIGDDVVDKTKVTVTSNNEKVATVDDEGKVSLTGATGEVTITAAVPGDETHAAGYASYTITVTDTTAPTTLTFYKANEIEDGEKYVIVSGGKALTADLGAQDVTIENDTFEAEPDEYTLWTAAAHVEYYEGTDAAGHFTLKNGEKYLQRKSNQSEQTLIVGAIPSNGKYYVWDYDGQHLDHLTLGNNTLYHYCVNYDDGWVVTSVADANNATYPTTVLYSTSKPRTKQVISFGEQPVTAKYDLNGAKWTVEVPTISGNKTDVTYSISGDESIKVNANSGEVTIENTAKKGDKATVTATAAQTDEYTSATASYTIEIIDSTPGLGTTYTLVTKQEDVVEGKYLIVSAADAYIFDGTGTYTGGYTTIADADAITLNENKITITGETAAFDFNFAKSGNGFTITGEQGMIVAAEHSGASTSTETYITFAQTGGSVFLQRGSLENKPEALLFSTTRGTSSNEYLYYHTTNKIFKIGGSGSSNGIHLYFAGERAAQTVSFASEAFTYDLAGEGSWNPSVPAVSGTYNTELVYASSNENVIKYDKDNGWVFGTAAKKNATATVTVTAPASDQYLSATASFTVTIVDSTPSTAATYYKADEIEAGKEYLIVSNGYALRNDDGTLAAVEAGSGDSFQFEEESTDLWTATADGDAFTLTNDSKYLRRSGSSYNVSLSIGSASSTAANNQWTYDAENNYVMSGTYYLYYSTSNSTFSISTTKSDTHIAALYSTTAPLPAWEISYDVKAAEYDLYTKAWTPSEPALTSATTNVTYASSNPAVATVSNTGVVTIVASGTATISATATADETHKKGVASYKLTVVNTDPALPKYTKVTSTSDLTVGAKYLIVFEGLEGDTDGDGDPKVFKPALNDAGTQFAKATSSALAVAIANSTITSDALGDYQFTLETGYYLKADKANKYIYPGTSGSSSVMLAESPASHALTITFNNGIAEIKNSSRYLVWSVSSHYFSSNTEVSGQYSTGICLYKLEGSGGSTPEPSADPSTYTQISFADGITTGKYLIVNPADAQVFTAVTSYPNAEAVTPASGVITGEYDNYEFTITTSGNTITIQNASGQYLYYVYTSGDTASRVAYQSTANGTWTPNSVASDTNGFNLTWVSGTSTQHIYWNETFFKIGSQETGVHLYKKN